MWLLTWPFSPWQLEQGKERTARLVEAADRAAGAAASAAATVATTLEQLSIRVADEATGKWRGRAIQLWREQGCVVFPSLLSVTIVATLRARIEDARGRRVDGADAYNSDMNDVKKRKMTALPVKLAAELLSAMASSLSPFLVEALRHPRQLLLENTYVVASPGAQQEEWHSAVAAYDERLASVHIALDDFDSSQGALQLLPGTHLLHGEEAAAAVAAANHIGGGGTGGKSAEGRSQSGVGGVTVAVPAGTVTLYSPHVQHRGSANTHSTAEPLSLVLTLVGDNGLLPPSLRHMLRPEDSWRWWLHEGGLHEREGGPGPFARADTAASVLVAGSPQPPPPPPPGTKIRDSKVRANLPEGSHVHTPVVAERTPRWYAHQKHLSGIAGARPHSEAKDELRRRQ